jgi:hypothetical protein
MGILSTLSLSSYFIQYVLYVVSLGVLVTEYFRENRERKAILRFFILYLMLTGLVIIDTYRIIVRGHDVLFTGLLLLLGIIIGSMFTWNSVQVWPAVNKRLFFSTLVISGVVLLEFILKLAFNISFEFFNSGSMLVASFLYSFFLINLLTGNSRNKK